MNSLKKNLAYNICYQILIIIIPLITTPYISRILGSSGIGVYSYNYSIANYFVLFIMLGLNNYGNREIAKNKETKEQLSETFWNLYAMQLFMGIIICFIYSFYCIFIAKDHKTAFIMLIYVFSGVLDINWFFWGMEKFRFTVLRNCFIKIATTVSIFFFVRSSEDTWKYCIIMTFGFLFSQLFLWSYLFREIYYIQPNWKKVKKHIKPNLFLFMTVIAVSLFKIMDKIMLGMMTNIQEVGLYESSEKIIQIPISLITALGTVMLPRMSYLATKKNDTENQILYKSIIFSMFTSSSLCFGIMGVAKEFVPLFYGQGFEKCIYLYLVLLPSCIFLSFANVIRTQYLLPHKMDKIYVISAFIGAGVNLGINLLLIPKFMAVGAGIGTLFAEISVCVYQSYQAKSSIPIIQYLKVSIPFLFSGILMFCVLYFIALPYSIAISLFLKIGLGIIIYVTAILLYFVIYKNASNEF